MISIIQNEISLFRYDLRRPEENWDMNHHSIEYEYNNLPEIFKYKNQIGAFFFYFSKPQAVNTALTACRNKGLDEFWITETLLLPRLKLLDLRRRETQQNESEDLDTPLKIITYLLDIGVDVLTKRFVRIESVGKSQVVVTPFEIIRPQFDELNLILSFENPSIEIIQKRFTLSNEINAFFHNNIGFLGQLLTDFTNGYAFKELLVNLGFDGYIFEEERATHIQTYCIFNSDHLSPPHSELDSIYNHCKCPTTD